jgi:hypothetical protein
MPALGDGAQEWSAAFAAASSDGMGSTKRFS